MHPRLKAHLMPWTMPAWHDKIMGCYTLVMVPLAISVYFTPLLLWPSIILLLGAVPVLGIHAVLHMRATRRLVREYHVALLAYVVHEARISTDNLPGEIQEEITMLRTRWHLRERTSEEHD